MSLFDRSGTDRSVCAAIVDAVAETAGVDPIELPPLYESVDVDAVETLFEPGPNANARTGTIRFPYYEYTVTVKFDADATVTVAVESADRGD